MLINLVAVQKGYIDMKNKKSKDRKNSINSKIAIIIMAFLVAVFTMAPDVVQAQRGRHGHGGPGGPSHMHGHHHPHPHPHPHPHAHFGWGPPVFFHPGPMWHPIGFFITTVAVTAIVVTVVNNNNEEEEYKYDDGTYYKETTQDGQTGYVAVPAPIGAKVPTLPSDNTEITVGSTTYYYYASTFYTQSGSDYVVVQPPPGATVPYVPDGYEKKEINGVQYYVYNNIYYLPKSDNGDIVYEVVEHP